MHHPPNELNPPQRTSSWGRRRSTTPLAEKKSDLVKGKRLKKFEKLNPDVKKGPPKHPFLTCLEAV